MTNTNSIYTIDLNNKSTISVDTSMLGVVNGITYTDISDSYPAGITIEKGDLRLHEDADIKIGNRSLMKTLDDMSERLAILETNSKLEAEFDELREVGNRYRILEKELKEKLKTWEILKRED